MERYQNVQNLPNSPLTPLTPLSENTAFNFNFGGDGSLDAYIDDIRLQQHLEKRRRRQLNKEQENQAHFINAKSNQQNNQYSYMPNVIIESPKNTYKHRGVVQQETYGGITDPLQTPKYSNKKLHQQRRPQKNLRPTSPILPKPLSPRISNLLQTHGLNNYRGLFQLQEIDLGAFLLLQAKDLLDLGIIEEADRKAILKLVKHARLGK